MYKLIQDLHYVNSAFSTFKIKLAEILRVCRDSHKTQRHEGELKAIGKSYFGASIHFSLKIEIKVPCRGEFRVFRSKLIRSDSLWYFYSSSIILGSPESDIQQKSLSNVSETKRDHMLISEFPQKVEPMRNCSFFSRKILF